jgi:hypothetical protein
MISSRISRPAMRLPSVSKTIDPASGGADSGSAFGTPVKDRDGAESQSVEITPGQVDWEEPTERIHRAVNVGKQPYEQVTIFFLDRPDAVPQPTEE